jgi:hypothetical protein
MGYFYFLSLEPAAWLDKNREGSEGEQFDVGAVGGRVPEVEEGQ